VNVSPADQVVDLLSGMDGGSPFGFGQLGGSGATGSVATLAPVGTANQPTIQISVLEVFGEDSDSRKKRFESSLHDNRYIEVSSLSARQCESSDRDSD